MANGLAVLGVIRAARPTFRSAHDRVAFAVHSAFLAGGYSLVAAGPAAEKPVAESSSEEAEVGIEGWNELDGAYAFRYSGTEQPGLCKFLMVKCTVVADLVMVEAAPSLPTRLPAKLEIKVKEYAKDTMAGNYGEQYSDLDGLVSRVNSSLISTLSPTSYWEARLNLNRNPPRSSGIVYRNLPFEEFLPESGAPISAPGRDVRLRPSEEHPARITESQDNRVPWTTFDDACRWLHLTVVFNMGMTDIESLLSTLRTEKSIYGENVWCDGVEHLLLAAHLKKLGFSMEEWHVSLSRKDSKHSIPQGDQDAVAAGSETLQSQSSLSNKQIDFFYHVESMHRAWHVAVFKKWMGSSKEEDGIL